MEKKIVITVLTSDAIQSDEAIESTILNELQGIDWWGNVERIKVSVETVVVSEEELYEDWD